MNQGKGFIPLNIGGSPSPRMMMRLTPSDQRPTFVRAGPGIPVVVQRPPTPNATTPPTRKLMRLRCRFRPLHEGYFKNGAIVEDDADVIFVCGDGHQLRAHKVIMATSSKFFAKIFEDQVNSMAVVSVPDIEVDVMKLILQLTYSDKVILTMRQIKEVGEFITMFGMAWSQFNYEEYEGELPLSSLPMAPIPVERVEIPRQVLLIPSRNPNPQAQQRQRLSGSSPIKLKPMNEILENGDVQDEGDHNQSGEHASSVQAQNERERRKSKLTPRSGGEGELIVEQEEEDPENKMKEWMSKLGKRNSSPGASPNENAAKRVRSDSGNDAKAAISNADDQTQKATSDSKTNGPCSTCGATFKTPFAWRWHEDRHVGHEMYKCQFCDELLTSPKMCFVHEKEVHGFHKITDEVKKANATASKGSDKEPRPNQSQPSTTVGSTTGTSSPSRSRPQMQTAPVKSNQAMRFVPYSANNAAVAVSKKIKAATLKKVQKVQGLPIKKPPNFAQRHPGIAIGASNGSELMDVKKIKQLHWLYVCQRCDTCTDSASKAVLHYNQCYPDKDEDFEQTVIKHRQGFYGKSKCPLCTRRYPQNSGFTIHCGHQHQQYRRLFQHTGSADDRLKCLGCKQIFPEPDSFHNHLMHSPQGTPYCGLDSRAESIDYEAEEGHWAQPKTTNQQASAPKKIGPGRPSTGKGGKPRPKRPESPVISKASYKVQFHTPPKSARLASRAQAEASAEAAKAIKQTSIDFPCVDCPVCGESDVPNISQHLQTKHTDLKIDVTRISSELLRCKNCTITFNICDLLDHKNCFENKVASTPEAEVAAVKEKEEAPPARRSSTSAAILKPPPKQPAATTVVDVDSLPPGVGRSPIERIEIQDLHSIEAIRSALECKVCGKKGRRLGIISDCLRSHGVHRCSLCFNSYANKNDYTLHLRKCHGASSNRLKCPLCPKSFSNAGQTSGHMYSTHWLQILKENELTSKTEEGGADHEDEEEAKNDATDSTEDGETSKANSEKSVEDGDSKEAKDEEADENESMEVDIEDDDDEDDREDDEEDEEQDTVQVEGSTTEA